MIINIYPYGVFISISLSKSYINILVQNKEIVKKKTFVIFMEKRKEVDNMKPYDICDLLFKQTPKPNGLEHCKAINVYDNKYRINVYTKSYDEFWDIDKIRITQSYFARLIDDKLEIISPSII